MPDRGRPPGRLWDPGQDRDRLGRRAVLHVELTDAGCRPAALTVPSGPVTFEVTNDAATGVTEYEVLDSSGRVLGEKENLAPGLSGSFSLVLSPGRYTLSCPGGTSAASGTLTVTGSGTGSESGQGSGSSGPTSSAAAATAVRTYRDYLVKQAENLAARTRTFTGAVVSGNLARAKALFAPTRAFYERIEPVAESFGSLDPAIDARVNDVTDPAAWTGFHRIEKGLWADRSTAGLRPFAIKLVADTATLAQRVRTVQLQPAEIANGASALIDEVTASKITGEEDPYSHTDLWDIEANVAGSREAFDAVRPLIDASDPALAPEISSRFDAVQGALEPFRRGDGFVSYTDLTDSDTRALSRVIDALAEPLSKLAAAVATA